MDQKDIIKSLEIQYIDKKIELLESSFLSYSKGDSRFFKAIWISLPLCLTLIVGSFGILQYLTFKNNADYASKLQADFYKSSDSLKSELDTAIKAQNKKVDDAVGTLNDENISTAIISPLTVSDTSLRVYPEISAKLSDSGEKFFEVKLSTYIGIRSGPDERGYLIATRNKIGGPILEKMSINKNGIPDQTVHINNFGFFNTYAPYVLITEHGSTITLSYFINRKNCQEARKVVQELQGLGTAGWLELTPLFKKIKTRPEVYRANLIVGESLALCQL